MNSRYLEITYRRGRPVAAYFYLPRNPGDISSRTAPDEQGLITDYTADGRAIGIEITSPQNVTLAAFNSALAAAQQSPATPDDIAPLLGKGFQAFASER
jgi:hypothetical protein